MHGRVIGRTCERGRGSARHPARWRPATVPRDLSPSASSRRGGALTRANTDRAVRDSPVRPAEPRDSGGGGHRPIEPARRCDIFQTMSGVVGEIICLDVRAGAARGRGLQGPLRPSRRCRDRAIPLPAPPRARPAAAAVPRNPRIDLQERGPRSSPPCTSGRGGVGRAPRSLATRLASSPPRSSGRRGDLAVEIT